ncbi:MAG: hypothetical protein IKY02_04545 [Lachnospiraceae bacterium]|nr:hypothetical protein [Lachnospiraceae bacterium]
MKAAGKKIADFTDEELVEFMREYAIPSHFRSYDVLETLKGWAAGLDEEPFMPTPYGYTETAVLARICWLAAASYYDWDYKYPEYNYPHGQRYVRKQALEQNTVFRVDEESMGFSDYAYLIGGRKVSNAQLDISVSSFIEYAPEGNTVTTLQDIVETIKGYPDTKREIISFSADRPEWGDLKEDEFALAIRQGTDGKYLSDVYFMRLTKDGWVHKPGASNTVLLFNQPLDESVDWISEMSLDGETFYQGSIVFSGPIYYIIYRIKEPTGNWEEP